MGMFEELMAFPSRCRKGWELGRVGVDLEGVRHVIVAGMGGSGIVGRLLTPLFPTLAIYPLPDYRLPEGLKGLSSEETLFFGVSYSGNTEETLSATEEAHSRGFRVICITSGGRLAEFARRNGLLLVNVPSGLLPRFALGYLLFPILRALGYEGRLVDEAIGELKGLAGRLGEEGSPAKRLAEEVGERIPVIYGEEGSTAPVAYRWRTQVNENAKRIAFHHSIPELCHNEIEAIGRDGRGAHFILLRHGWEHPRNAERFEVLKGFLNEWGLSFTEVWGEGQNLLGQLLSLVLFGDFFSLYLASLRGVDPYSTEVIEELKRRMGWRSG